MFGDFWKCGQVIAYSRFYRYYLNQVWMCCTCMFTHMLHTQPDTSDQTWVLLLWSPLVFPLQTHIIDQCFSLSLLMEQLWILLSSSSPSKGQSLHSCFTYEIDVGSLAVSVKMAIALKPRKPLDIREKLMSFTVRKVFQVSHRWLQFSPMTTI